MTKNTLLSAGRMYSQYIYLQWVLRHSFLIDKVYYPAVSLIKSALNFKYINIEKSYDITAMGFNTLKRLFDYLN